MMSFYISVGHTDTIKSSKSNTKISIAIFFLRHFRYHISANVHCLQNNSITLRLEISSHYERNPDPVRPNLVTLIAPAVFWLPSYSLDISVIFSKIAC